MLSIKKIYQKEKADTYRTQVKGLREKLEAYLSDELHPNQINDWKKEFTANAAVVFSKGKTEPAPMDDKEKQKLHQVIGQLKVENDFLKKALS